MASYSPGVQSDPEAGFVFSEKSIRLAFIRKVYGITISQLLILTGFVALFIFVPPVQKFVSSHMYLWIIAFCIVFVLIIVLACCPDFRRKSPANLICLFILVLAYSFMVATAAATYQAYEVLLALGLTSFITLGLTLFSFQTRIDFTGCGGYLFALSLALLVGGIFAVIFPSRWSEVLYATAGAALMAVYIIFDTQLMIGGSYKYSVSPEEYIFASLNLFLDFVNLFLFILQIIGRRN